LPSYCEQTHESRYFRAQAQLFVVLLVLIIKNTHPSCETSRLCATTGYSPFYTFNFICCWLLHWYLVIMTMIVSDATSPTSVDSFVPTLPGKHVLVRINVVNLFDDTYQEENFQYIAIPLHHLTATEKTKSKKDATAIIECNARMTGFRSFSMTPSTILRTIFVATMLTTISPILSFAC